MSNLIPQFAKKKITTEYWLRVMTVWFFLWGAALLIGTVLLFPVYIFTNVQIEVNAASAASAVANVANYDEVASNLRKASIQARLILEDSRRNKAHEYLALVTRNEDVGVKITEVRFSETNQGVQPMIISGVAETREALAAFRDRLLAEAAIVEADLPISNLARDRDITFSITIEMNKAADL